MLISTPLKFLTCLLFIGMSSGWGVVQANGSPDSTGRSTLETPERPPLVFHFELAEDIMPPAWRTVKRAMEEADQAGADLIVMSLDTYGGMVNLADSISQRLLHNRANTVVYIVNNAASAGALISLSCDRIYMSPSAQIGAATVVSGTDGEAMPDKYQAYMRAKMRSLAEASGRDPRIAEAMVDQDVEIPGLIAAGKTLVFTSSEAVEHGYCEGIYDTWQECVQDFGYSQYTVKEFQLSGVDRMVKFLVNPIVSGLLLMVIFIGIYAELQTPGVGFPLLAAAIAAVLYFAPHYLDGLAANWEIALFLIGIVLLAVEVFVLPGFGIAGIAGITGMVVAMILTMVHNVHFDFEWTATQDVVRAVLVVVLALLLSIGFIFTLLGSLTDSPLMRRLVLLETQQRERGFTTTSFTPDLQMQGRLGISITDLRPAGKVEIGSQYYDAMTEGAFISKGTKVQVHALRNSYLLVRPAADVVDRI